MKRAVLGIALVCIAVIIGVWVAERGDADTSNREATWASLSARWNRAGDGCEARNPRGDILDEVRNRLEAQRLDRSAVRRLLGTPSSRYPSPDSYLYGVGAQLDCAYLEIRFGSDGRVEDTDIYFD